MALPFTYSWRTQPALILPFPKGRREVFVSNIIRLEGRQNYTLCYFSDGSSLIVALTIKTLLERLPPNTLIRLHRKHAVNPDYISQWNSLDSYVKLKTGEQITIARRRRETSKVSLHRGYDA